MWIACTRCGADYPLDTQEWKCLRCEGLFELQGAPQFDPSCIDPNSAGLWRYRSFLPLPEGCQPVTLGEGWTPLVESDLEARSFLAKLDFLTPSGSFKDRGTTILVSALLALGIDRVVEDSSGNAAASLAAYCARARIHAEIFVPAHASPAKLAQILVYGAQLRPVEGPRENSARAVQEEAGRGLAYYASHYYNPYALAGMETTAWEIWEQLGRRAPGSVIAPVGHGTNLLGLVRGFRKLLTAGLIEQMPRVYAAQAANIAPLFAAFDTGLAKVLPVEGTRTIAEGIAIPCPLHGTELLEALRSTGGAAIAVHENAIIAARAGLARRGLYVEPTSAAAVAALQQVPTADGADPIVITLTGSGLKSP